MDLAEIRIEFPLDQAETVSDVLLEFGLERWSVLEDVIVRRAWLVGIFPSPAEAQEQWRALQPSLPPCDYSAPVVRTLGDADWRDSYKAHFHAWQFGRLHWVPVWEREKFQLPAGHAVLWLDPGLAFGTGNHETTRLCVERLVALAEAAAPGARVIDAGCGSGILALSASLLGFRYIVGFDNDPEAVRVSGENAALNQLGDHVEFYTADLVTGLAGRQAEVVLANIQADILQRYAAELIAAVAPHGCLVLSGILAAENDQVRATFSARAPGWKIESRILGEWSDLILAAP